MISMILLLEARRELDERLDKNSSPGEEMPLGKFQDSDADDLYESHGEFDPHGQYEGSRIDLSGIGKVQRLELP